MSRRLWLGREDEEKAAISVEVSYSDGHFFFVTSSGRACFSGIKWFRRMSYNSHGFQAIVSCFVGG